MKEDYMSIVTGQGYGPELAIFANIF